MRKTLLFIFSLCCFSSFAKDGFFLQPTIGVGLGGMKVKPNPENMKLILVHSEIIGFGYQFEHLILSSGIGYAVTGGGAKIVYTDYTGNPIGTSNARWNFNHIIVPLTVGYRKTDSNKFSIYPVIGAEFTYNYSERTKASGVVNGNTVISGEQFRQMNRSMSVFALIQLNMEFQATKKIHFVLAPKVDYMVTNMYKDALSAKIHNYTFLVNAGIKWNL